VDDITRSELRDRGNRISKTLDDFANMLKVHQAQAPRAKRRVNPVIESERSAGRIEAQAREFGLLDDPDTAGAVEQITLALRDKFPSDLDNAVDLAANLREQIETQPDSPQKDKLLKWIR